MQHSAVVIWTLSDLMGVALLPSNRLIEVKQKMNLPSLLSPPTLKTLNWKLTLHFVAFCSMDTELICEINGITS